jgi:hypothetical protein
MNATDATGSDSDVLAGLAREVEALHRRVDELARLGNRVDELGSLVARLAHATGPKRDAPSQAVLSWLDLDAPDHPRDAAEILGMLGRWVARVYLRYSDARLPDCWLWHPELVEELLWLHAAWLAAYDPDASVAAVGDWHDRQRPGVVARIHKYAGLCSLEAHRPGQERHLPAPAAPTTDAVPAIASWWATHRTEPAPTPTDEQLATATARMIRSRR